MALLLAAWRAPAPARWAGRGPTIPPTTSANSTGVTNGRTFRCGRGRNPFPSIRPERCAKRLAAGDASQTARVPVLTFTYGDAGGNAHAPDYRLVLVFDAANESHRPRPACLRRPDPHTKPEFKRQGSRSFGVYCRKRFGPVSKPSRRTTASVPEDSGHGPPCSASCFQVLFRRGSPAADSDRPRFPRASALRRPNRRNILGAEGGGRESGTNRRENANIATGLGRCPMIWDKISSFFCPSLGEPAATARPRCGRRRRSPAITSRSNPKRECRHRSGNPVIEGPRGKSFVDRPAHAHRGALSRSNVGPLRARPTGWTQDPVSSPKAIRQFPLRHALELEALGHTRIAGLWARGARGRHADRYSQQDCRAADNPVDARSCRTCDAKKKNMVVPRIARHAFPRHDGAAPELCPRCRWWRRDRRPRNARTPSATVKANSGHRRRIRRPCPPRRSSWTARSAPASGARANRPLIRPS